MKKEYLLIIILAIIIVVLTAVLFFPTKTKAPQINGIEVTSPKIGETVSSPVKITGVVNGNGWVGFEGQVGTAEVVDYKGNVIGRGVLKATTEWTILPTNFEATIDFTPNNPGLATLQFKNENPSGDPVKDKIFSLNINVK